LQFRAVYWDDWFSSARYSFSFAKTKVLNSVWSFVSDIAIFVLKGDVKLQL